MILRLMVLFSCLALTTNQAFSALIVTISPGAASYSVGSTVQMNVFVTSTLASESITGFDLTFDLQGPGGSNVGAGLPTGIQRNSSAFLTNAFILPVSPLAGTTVQANPLGTDVYISAEGVATFNQSSTRVFTLNFDVGAGAADGTYELRIPNSIVNNFYDNNADPIANSVYNTGSFLVVSAVPEPSSMALVGLMFAGAVGFQRRLRKKNQA